MKDRREPQQPPSAGGATRDPLRAGLHLLIEQVVERRPEAAALRFDGEVLSYAALNQRANQCAHYLRELGVGPDVLVGVLMERSVELVIGLLAILKAGGAYLPLATDCPAERLGFMLKDAGISIVLTRSESVRRLDEFGVTALSLDAERELLDSMPNENPVAVTGPRDLAYVIYTSGSTGRPKGCMIEHGSIINRLVWMRDHYGISDTDRILQKTPYTFDVSVWEFFLPLISASTLVLAKPGGHKDNPYLQELIQAEGVTVCHFVPSMLRFFLRQPGVAECGTLRHVFVSGEALPYALMTQCLRTLSSKLHNLYGPTEAAVDVTYWECGERPDQKAPIGRPIANTDIRILDENLRQVPPGEAGELFVGGIGVGRGYLNRPELTRERFVKDPADAASRLYRTGDKARVLADGQIEYLGRLDFQVKIRGFRVELGEIEATLRGHEAIEDAAVLVRDENSDDPKLVAYVVFRNQPLSTKEVRDFIKRKLPEYMAPNAVAALSAFPVNGNGKLDRSALPWPISEAPSGQVTPGAIENAEPPAKGLSDVIAESAAQSPHAAERVFSQLADGEIAADLRGLFQRALGMDALADTGDLFDLGATSFTMVQAVEYIQAQYGVLVPVDVFFDTPTIQAIAAYVSPRAEIPPAPTPQRISRSACAGAPLAAEPPQPSAIALEAAEFTDEAYARAVPVRQFSGQPVPMDALGRLLSLLRCHPDRPGPKYLYSSAGGLRSVQTYLFIRETGVERLPEGYYYYHPEEHRLYVLDSGPRVGASVFCAYDRPVFANAGFVVFLIAQLDAIQPIYGNASPVLTVVEAGYMAQALTEQQAAFGLGLCPVGGVDFAAIQSGFQLDPSHRFLHCLLGGVASSQSPESATGGLVDFLKTNGSGIHAHCADYRGERTFSHFLEAVNLDDRLPTPEQKEELHRQKLHLRRFERGAKTADLKAWEAEAGYYLLRSAKRVYREAPIAFARFSRFMAMLAADTRRGLARHLYPSITGTYPLKVFIYLKAGGVEGVPEGLYRYDCTRHQLRLVTRTLSTDLKSCYTPFNRKHYQPAKFCLFLVGPTAELKPIFGADSTYLALLESGYIGQMLLDRQAEFELGVCPIGGMRYEKIRDDFKLDPEDVCLHSFVGGEVAPECPIPWEPLEAGPADRPRREQFALEESRRQPAISRGAVAVVGISGRYPGAENLDALTRNLREGKSSFRELRFDPEGPYRSGTGTPDGQTALRHWGGFLEDVDCFDSLLFQITPAEARTMDPQERLLLEVAWECLENSGYTGAELNRVAAKVGVFVGAMWDDYQHHRPEVWPPARSGEAISAHHSSIANRLSFFFDFKGPSVAVNTSCSSALTALHFGCRSLLAGECRAALVGGVNLMAHPYHQWVLSAAELLSGDDACRPFGLKANGWVAGEGAGAVLLKPLSDAVRDRDTIHGVILGTTISHSGRTGRYGAPHSQRQAESMREALEQAGISADTISYIEAAAPGAGMADASEAAAIKAVFATPGTQGPTIHVGSVKANLGHLESASAMSQLAKVLLQLKHGQIFPTLGFQPTNPLVQWQGIALKIPDAVVPWPATSDGQTGAHTPRRALINAFGATGSGGHLVIEEFPAPALADAEVETLIVLSAATSGQLSSAARRLREFLDQPDASAARIADIGYTLRVGREPMKMRLALIVRSRGELRDLLAAFLAGAKTPPAVYIGEVDGKPCGECQAPDMDLHEVAAKWVVGACGLGKRKDDASARRVPLPTYPFAKERHWVGVHPAAPGPEPVSAASTLRPQVEAYLKGLFSGVTGIPRDRIETRATFDAYGMTSLMVKRLNELLAKDFGPLSSALLFERQTIDDLADYLVGQHPRVLQALFGETPAPGAQPVPCARPSVETETKRAAAPLALAPARHTEGTEREIAIVGVSGRYPQAANVAAFWENLKNGIDCITEIPADRWDDARLQVEAGKHSRWGGFIDGVDEFDPLFFRISPKEAQEMDPQERLFLQTVWHLFEDAGYAPSTLSRQTRARMGVFVGVMYGEYQLHSHWEEKKDDGLLVSSLYGSIANRVSYVLDFHGPSMAVDTLCSSSLTALHLAMQSVRSGECDAAVVGGVNLSIHPHKYLLHAQSSMSSSDGRCRSFGKGGDGFVPGEGVGAILIKSLDQALRDGDQIYAIVKATAINQDGKTHGFTVPNPNAQASMVSEAIRKAGVDPRLVSYVEAHGTGTALGDPIEIAGLTKAFGEFTSDRRFCAIGSVKSNIGHLESAAGIAGLTKILLQMRHRQLAPSLHSRELNPEIRFETTPFFVQQTLSDWERPRVEEDGVARSGPRLACISSFGAGGSNAHAIIEEYECGDVSEPAGATGEPQLIVLSAKDKDRLQAVVADLRDFTRQEPACRLADLAYTLQVGREAMEERLAFVVSSFADLEAVLEAILDGREDTVLVYRGTLDPTKATLHSLLADEDLQGAINAWIEKRKFDRILRAWVEGAKVEWRRLHGDIAPRKVSLPGYPFARERYWVPKRPPTSTQVSWLHPLLHRNTSDLWEQRYISTFDGREFFLNDHRLRGDRVLPAAACLEMARAAVEQATRGGAGQIRLQNVVWIQPFSVTDQGRVIHVGLRADERGGVRFEIYADEPPAPKMVISQGSASFGPPDVAPRLDLKSLRERLERTDLSPAQCYEAFRAFGLEHGPAFLSLREIRRDGEAVLARVALPPSVIATRSSYVLHPALIDGLFQATLALGNPGSSSPPAIPYALDELTCYQPCEEEMWAYVRPRAPSGAKLDLDLCDASGTVCVRIQGFSTRAIEPDRPPQPLLSHPVWREGSSAKNGSAPAWARHFVAPCGVDPSVALDLTMGIEGVTCVPLQPGTGDPAARFEAVAVQTLEFVKRILSEKMTGETLLQVLISTKAGDRVYRGLSGLLRTAHHENPAFTGQVIEIEDRTDAAAVTKIVAENRLHPEDAHVVYEKGRRAVLSWEPLPDSEPPTETPWKNGGVYLITGGAGELGLLFAREIARKTDACVLVLASRSALIQERENRLRALERPGVVVHYRQVDVTDSNAVQTLVRDILKDHGSLSGILHAAGVVRDNFILKKTADELRAVLAPKTRGTVCLDEATRDADLDFFALFSSTTGALGNIGQADYAAANGFLDAFADLRNALVRDGKRHGHTLAINWPLWKDGGMKVNPGLLTLLTEESGIEPLESSPGLEAFARALASGSSQVMVQPRCRETMCASSPAPEPCSAPRPAQASAAMSEATGPLPERALRFFRALLASTIRCPIERIKVDEPFDSYGIDSLMVMQMTNELEKSFGSLSKTLFFEHHNIRSLTGYFLETRGEALQRLLIEKPPIAVSSAVQSQPTHRFGMPMNFPVGVPVTQPSPQPASEALDIAIIGLAGRYPQANDLETFWDNLSQGKNCITEIPADRWDWKPFFDPERSRPGGHYGKWGGFMDHVDAFDPLFFNIAPKDARYMDPQERLFLETSWAALEDAGYRPRDLRRSSGRYLPSQVGVYAGVMYSEYQLLAHEETLAGNPTVVGNIYASIANRVSYFLDLHGPSMTIDTMCSSSLTGIHLACLDLKHNRTDLALAGGVNVTIHPNKYLLLSVGQFISAQGRCGSFGQGGDGYVPGEGVGVVVLKRLEDAIRDGDHIYGVIKGSAVNHGGKTNGFTVPNPEAQHEVITRALETAGISPARVTYVEAHSTGTPLGDPIEIAGLTKAFKASRVANGRCFLGSVKSNIGHCEGAAGIAGLTKVLLQMKHGQLAPSLHSEVLNPNLDLASTPFNVNQTLRDWERRVEDGRTLPYVAGISGFGAGGSNAHLIVEEYVEPPKPLNERPDHHETAVIILSARNEKRLLEMAARLRRFLETSRSIALADVAYTLQVGRLPMEERLGFTANSTEELLDLLDKATKGSTTPGIRRGRVVDGAAETLRALAEDDDMDLTSAIERWVSKGKQEKLIDLWVGGLNIDWLTLYSSTRPRRISLPTYPFARDRYWLPRNGSGISVPAMTQDRPDNKPVPETDTWLAVREEWVPEPWPESLDWQSCLRKHDDRRVTLLVSDVSEGQVLLRLIRQLEDGAGLTSEVRVEIVRLDGLADWRVEQPPGVVLIMAPQNPDADERHISTLFHLSQKLMREAWDSPIRIYHLHERSETQPRLRLEALGGLLRSAMLENEHHVWTCISVQAGVTAEARVEFLLREWLADEGAKGFYAIRYQGAERRRHRLVEHQANPGVTPVFRPRGTYLLAGGLGPIGEQLCGELARRYGPSLVILSRGAFDEGKREQCRRLESLGARVSYYQVDIADRTALEAIWPRVKSEVGTIHGVIHLARGVEDGLLVSKPWDAFERVIRAKVDGTLNLDELTSSEPLDFFLLFSSMAAFGIRGSSDYGYASAFQNAFAYQRALWVAAGARAGKTLACGWGSWNVDKYHSESRNVQLRETGFSLIDLGQAFPWIESRCWQNEPFLGLMLVHNQSMVRSVLALEDRSASVDPVSSIALEERIAQWEQRKRDGGRITAIEVGGVLRSDQVGRLNDALTDRLHALLDGSGNGHGNGNGSHQARLEPEVTDVSGDLILTIKRCLADLLELDEVEDTKSFHDYGMDSISGVRFSMSLEKKLKLEVPPQLLLEHPNPRALAAHLATTRELKDGGLG